MTEQHRPPDWLAETHSQITDEQRTQLDAIWLEVASRWDAPADRLDAFRTAVNLILGDDDLAAAGRGWDKAKTAERRAMRSLTGAIIAAHHLGVSEVAIARQAGVNRMTVRKALGK